MIISTVNVKHIFSDIIIPSSGTWNGITHIKTNEYEFRVELNFESDNTFTGSADLKPCSNCIIRENSVNVTGHWNGQYVKFKSGNYTGIGYLMTNNKIEGQWSDGTLQYSFQMTKTDPNVLLL